MSPFHTILVAVDFSETAGDTLDAALGIAGDRAGRIHLLHVVPDLFHSMEFAEAPTLDWHAMQRESVEKARTQLFMLAVERKLDPLTITVAVEIGPAAAEIVRYANECGAELIVLGSHGHGVVRRFILGSVADRVLRHASCPAMLVPHRAFRTTPLAPEAVQSAAS
jgi:nucleotide-binding universal stress UspA family protein